MSLTMSMRRPGPSNTQEDALVSFDQALTDGSRWSAPSHQAA
jgi:hypothetical protein